MKSVIIVDDDLDWSATLSDIVNSRPDFNVVATACNGKEGRLLIEHYLPHLVIMDIMMPDEDGLKVIKHIRENCGQYNPFIYIITAMDTPSIENMLLDLEVDCYDFKPVGAEELVEKLNCTIVANPKEVTSHSKKLKGKDAADIIEGLLFELGIPPHLHGSDCIKTALFFMLDNPNMKRNIYAMVSGILNCSSDSVKKNVRTAIVSCMDSNLYKSLFGTQRTENLEFLFSISSLARKRMLESEVA